jgi:hypothetical protein
MSDGRPLAFGVALGAVLLGGVAKRGSASDSGATIVLKCRKSLFKSTYRKNAFTKGRKYEVVSEDDYVWVRDNTGRPFTFSRTSGGPFYVLSDYFESSARKITRKPIETIVRKVFRVFEKEGIDDMSDYSPGWLSRVVGDATGRTVLGVGGSRIVLDLGDGTVLKIAPFDGGRSNLSEARLFFSAEDAKEQALIGILVPVIDVSDGTWLRMAKAVPVEEGWVNPRLAEILRRVEEIREILTRYEDDPRFEIDPTVIEDMVPKNVGWHDGVLKALDYGG